jgi:diguanylate cyclase (GGDEF)-like protein
LIAEDDPVSRRVLETMLMRWGYQTVVACDGSQAWAQLNVPDPPRLAILDWMMPGLSGVDVCQLVRQGGQGEYLYIILLTARGRMEDIIEGMNAGADDYITKPFDSGELKVRLRAAKRILDLQAELIAAREALREQATHDFLTSLWNRAAILDILREELSRAARNGKPLGVMMADLDEFKKVNDTYGHKAGDVVLAEAANRMRQSTRPYDRIGRYGGEEFLVVVPGCDLADAEHAAQRVRSEMARAPFHLPNGTTIHVTVSIGVTARGEGNLADADGLIHSADEALYQAKRSGRNCVSLTDPNAAQPVAAPLPPAATIADR